MTEPIDEAAVLAEMTAKLEAEGMTASADVAPFVPLPLPSIGVGSAPPQVDCTYPEWMAQQQPASLAYLRELVHLARDSGMTHIRTGNLEMKFDPDARKPATPGDKRESF